MAIWTYVGLPRNGKSYNVVAEQIIPALKQGRRVVTNIPLLPDGLAAMGCDVSGIVQLRNSVNDGPEFPDLAEKPAEVIGTYCTPGSLCVFDEFWRFLPQGVQAKNVDPAWQTLFAEHGHRVDAQGRMMQIVLVTQDLSQIAAFARSLVERTIVVTKLTVVGAASTYRADVYAGHVTGLKPPASKRIAEEFGKYDPEIFKCYVSRTMAEGSASKVDESVMSKRGTLLRHPMVRFGAPIAVCLISWGLWKSYEFFFVRPAEMAEASKSKAAERVKSVVERVSAPVRVEAVGMRLRVAAVLRAEDDSKSMVLLDHCDGTPSRWLQWHAGRCVDAVTGGVQCEWRGRKYEFHAAIQDCRQADERRAAEIRWLPLDGGGSRESISVIGGSSVDGAGG